MDIEGFYRADERRRRSEEVEFGTDWHDSAKARYEVSWVADTGELYVMREPTTLSVEDPFGDVFRGTVPVGDLTVAVVGWVPDRDDMEQVMAGWEEAITAPDSISWLAGRLRDEGVAQAPPTP